MKKFACRYAIVQFLPYSETGEFANVGVVLMCPSTGYFDFKLEMRRHARVTHFFEQIDSKRYRATVEALQAELRRLCKVAADLPEGQRADALRNLFTHLVSPRETVMRFGDARPILTDDPAKKLEQLFGYYVNRNFATPEYIENVLSKRLKNLIHQLQLPNPFKPEDLGNGQIHANFPLVQRVQGNLTKAIKPFNLSHQEPNDIYAHGDTWVMKVKRMREWGLLPPHVMFAVEMPPQDEEQRWRAFSDIRAQLIKQDVEVTPVAADQRIIEFARE